ncbi:PstS family phosphate ABC transporter substrate-binding protein [Halorussus litoreus]|uniref:PstS family phosphate ABC transporter substrate-binding protein n=1 Tax=Halorussus litoreus TaxID=1710536 RepID=UPI0018E53624|nr:substrate-binding domain-containing protein [Halorussus litoreus]
MNDTPTRREALQLLGVGSVASLAGCSGVLRSGDSQNSIRISGGVGPLPMVQVWAEEYRQNNDVSIDISGGGTGVGVSDVLNDQVDVAMMGRAPTPEERDQGLFAVPMLRDTVVGTVNPENPVLDAIQEQGLSRADLEAIFTREVTTWGEVVDAESDAEITVYGRSDASAAYKKWATFVGDYTQSELADQTDGNFDGDQQVAQAIGKEPTAIAFNNVNYIWDFETGELSGNVRPVPLDLNDNDALDENESFYSSRDEFLSAVEDGTYPAPPAREMFLASKNGFGSTAKPFVEWVLTDGQSMVRDNGYVPLDQSRLEEANQKLEDGA